MKSGAGGETLGPKTCTCMAMRAAWLLLQLVAVASRGDTMQQVPAQMLPAVQATSEHSSDAHQQQVLCAQPCNRGLACRPTGRAEWRTV